MAALEQCQGAPVMKDFGFTPYDMRAHMWEAEGS
jgi:hypothetical protein